MTADPRWARAGSEPSISDVMSDPTVRTLMAADGVSPAETFALIKRLRASLRPAPAGAASPRPSPIAERGAAYIRPAQDRLIGHRPTAPEKLGMLSRCIAIFTTRQRPSAD